MNPTSFWLIRHALVEENARAILYGVLDVPVCETSMLEQAPMYRALANRLPRPAHWKITPLSRTHRTAQAIFAAGYPGTALTEEPGMIEQSLGKWQGLPHAELPAKLAEPPHPFWPLTGTEIPPGGESMVQVITRVAGTLERLATQHTGEDVVMVSHGGAIRAALAHALRILPDSALHLSVQNLSLTRLEHHGSAWRVVCVNELSSY
ncbi:MAG: histidine phosphatase family protein [Acetobacteraceae bacterium]|nr:histidine phosphatase family protein [Acetobacteraceae bacterium]